MAQPQRGPTRTEVSDLRNIVDRLDLLMGATAEGAGEGGRGLTGTARQEIEMALNELTERVAAIEQETEELRTLVNHLMTIATWQAKVTASLVGDEEEEEAEPADEDVYESPYEAPPDRGFVDRVGHHVEGRRHDEQHAAHHAAATSLDDDIDDILGTTDREPSPDDGPPPDFGI